MLSSFVLKIIACVTMFIDHFGYILFDKFSWFNYIGRLAFPIFAFQISEGYVHTKSLKKYFFKLILFACISQIPYYFFINIIHVNFSLNVIFTLIVGLLAILLYDKLNNKILGVLCVIALACIAQLLKMDYGIFGVFTVFAFYLFKNNKLLTALSFLILVIYKYSFSFIKYGFTLNYILLFLCTFSAIIPILFYNKKQGKKAKYLFYFFYPVQFIILIILSFVI